MSFRWVTLILLFFSIASYRIAFAEITQNTAQPPAISQNNSITQPNKISEFLVIADLHFNPFSGCENLPNPCPLVRDLSAAPASAWPDIFKRYSNSSSNSSLPSYHSETNYPLLLSLQEQLKSQKPKFVLVLGDFLAHSFYQKYIAYSNDPHGQYYSQFANKTFSFLAITLATALPPQTPIYPVIGNNDSNNPYCYSSNYCESGNFELYSQFAKIWQPNATLASNQPINPMPINAATETTSQTTVNTVLNNQTNHQENNNPASWTEELARNGYYRVPAKAPNDPNLLILNSVLFSNQMQSAHIELAARQQLAWLAKQLKDIHQKKQRAWIIMHIPPGIDAYNTYKNIFRTIKPFWKENYWQRFFFLMQKYHQEITAILSAHTHMDNAIIFHLKNPGTQPNPHDLAILIDSGTPSISPIYGTNPAYKVYFYRNDLQLTNFDVYFLPLKQKNATWQLEYDFNAAYGKKCSDCPLRVGFAKIKEQKDGKFTQSYIKYFASETNGQPITNSFGYPYYWCALHQMTQETYNKCIYKHLPVPKVNHL